RHSGPLRYAVREKMSAALLPQKPTEVDITACSEAGRDWSRMRLIAQAGSSAAQFVDGGMHWCSSARMLITASIAALAPRQWPVMGLVALHGKALARGPKT